MNSTNEAVWYMGCSEGHFRRMAGGGGGGSRKHRYARPNFRGLVEMFPDIPFNADEILFFSRISKTMARMYDDPERFIIGNTIARNGGYEPHRGSLKSVLDAFSARMDGSPRVVVVDIDKRHLKGVLERDYGNVVNIQKRATGYV